MKTLLILVAICPFIVVAQDYHPIIEDDKVWLEAFYIGANICSYESVYQMRFGGDTLIEGNTYRKIMKRNFSSTSTQAYCPPFVADDFENELGSIFMRENTDSQQVFLSVVDNDNPDGYEVLLYDFTLEVGDTIPVSSYATLGIIPTVESIEEYTLLNGETRKKINLDYDESYFIEGIGGKQGLFQPYFQGIGFDWSTLCVQVNQESIYSQNSSSTFCGWVFTSINEIPKLHSSLFPNPGPGDFVFELNRADFGSAELHLTLFSITGQKIFSAPVTADRNYFQTNAGSGLYLWQLQSNGEILNSGKLLVE